LSIFLRNGQLPAQKIQNEMLVDRAAGFGNVAVIRPGIRASSHATDNAPPTDAYPPAGMGVVNAGQEQQRRRQQMGNVVGWAYLRQPRAQAPLRYPDDAALKTAEP